MKSIEIHIISMSTHIHTRASRVYCTEYVCIFYWIEAQRNEIMEESFQWMSDCGSRILFKWENI